MLLSPLACRGQFDIAQPLADGDTDSESGESGVDDSPEADAEEADTDSETSESPRPTPRISARRVSSSPTGASASAR